jgi:hypothetical protein
MGGLEWYDGKDREEKLRGIVRDKRIQGEDELLL